MVMSPLATIEFKLLAVVDTGLRAGWVRCKHVVGRNGAGGGKCCSLAPGSAFYWCLLVPLQNAD